MDTTHRYLLTDTLIREMTEESEQILQILEQDEEFEYTIQLIEEPGEVLITRMMSNEQIEEAVNEAIRELFPGKKVSDIVKSDVFLRYRISN